MPRTKKLPIVVTDTAASEVRAQLIDRGMKPSSSLAAKNEVWRVVRLSMDSSPRRTVWTPRVLGVLMEVTRRDGEDGPEAVVRINQNHYHQRAGTSS